MKTFKVKINPKMILPLISGEYIQRNDIEVDNASELYEANESSVCFYENPQFFEMMQASKAGLIFVPEDFDESLKTDCNLLKVKHPYMFFMMMVSKWIELENPKKETMISPNAVIHNSAKIGENVIIEDYVVIKENVIIGDGCIIEANSVIEPNVVIGNNCHFYPSVTIYEDCIIKNNVILHSGVVIGADGFGYFFHEGQQKKIPQIGNVVLEDDVEIGANSCIDRATLASTIIGKGTKIDNLVQIGHNCKVGKNTILCAQVGLAGSTIVGDRVFLAGQVGAAGHIEIGNDVMVGAQSGIAKSVKSGEKLFGTPAVDHRLSKKIAVSLPKLPELVKQMNKRSK